MNWMNNASEFVIGLIAPTLDLLITADCGDAHKSQKNSKNSRFI
jgi:hypothetical protein